MNRPSAAPAHGHDELADLAEHAPFPLRLVDVDGRIRWANPADLELVGYAGDEYVGRHLSELHPDREATEDLLERFRRREPLRDHPARIRRKDGAIRHVLITSSPMCRDGALVYTRCYLRDVTAEVEARAEQAARERFRELLLGMLGHDLRNPLGAITSGTELLARRHGDETSARVIGRISRSAARMARMIDHVLECARLGAGGMPLSLQPGDLADVCATVIDELQAQHPDRRIEVQRQGLTTGWWDRDRLSQVLSNLIGNALVYGDPAEPIRILVTQDQDHVSVQVHNGGPPIPDELVPTIFDPFRRARPMTTADRGLGLGLYITKQIVVGHGGVIDVRSTAAEGTTFRFRLPRRLDARAANASASTAA